MNKEKTLLRINQSKVSLKEKIMYHPFYCDVIFREEEIIFINKDDSYAYEIGLWQLGALGKGIAKLFTRKQQAKIKQNENKSLEEILMSDPAAKKLTYHDILAYKFKRDFNEYIFTLKGRTFKKCHIHVPTEILGNVIEILKRKCPHIVK